jgi:hypothetical protein
MLKSLILALLIVSGGHMHNEEINGVFWQDDESAYYISTTDGWVITMKDKDKNELEDLIGRDILIIEDGQGDYVSHIIH